VAFWAWQPTSYSSASSPVAWPTQIFFIHLLTSQLALLVSQAPAVHLVLPDLKPCLSTLAAVVITAAHMLLSSQMHIESI
jgi:hypothetical protein